MKAVTQDAARGERRKQTTWVASILHIALSPWLLYRWLIYSKRPDVVTQKTRAPEWAALRSQWRWTHALFVYLGPPSHILWKIKWPLLFNMIVAGIAMGDAVGFHDVVLTSTINSSATMAWRLSSFMLSLLMAFKVNRVYDRWWMGRQAFAGVGTAAYTMAQQAVVWVKDPHMQEEIIRWCKIWQYSIYGLLMREKALHPNVARFLDKAELDYYSKSRKGRNLVTLRFRQLLTKAGLNSSEFRAMDNTLGRGMIDQGICSRIMFQCMPYSLTLMGSGFLEIWLLLMPFGLFTNMTGQDPRMWGNPAFEMLLYLLICVLMLGVDEVAGQLEQPFAHMPLMELVETTIRDIDRLQEEAATLARLGEQRMQRLKQQGDRDSANAADTAEVPDISANCTDAVVVPMHH